MKFTNISQVRNHLYRLNPGQQVIRDYALKLIADEYANLPHMRLESGSEVVKAIQVNIPLRAQVTMSAGPVALPHQHLVSESIVCAADSSLGTVFKENIDYTIDYTAGTVSLISGGAIMAGSILTVWYLYYRVFARNVDYRIDYERGRLQRITSGEIEDGQEVFVDYLIGASEFSDSEIEQAIIEAEAEINSVIDAAYSESASPALQTAATWLTMAIICRNSAGIAQGGDAGARSTSGWLDLANSYRDTATRLLSWFRRDVASLKPGKLA